MIQQEGQSIADFTRQLRLVADSCEFESNYEERLLDQFLSGLRNSRTKKRLLITKALTLDLAIRTSIKEERATQEAQIMENRTAATAHKVIHKDKPWSKEKQHQKYVKKKDQKPTQKAVCPRCKL